MLSRLPILPLALFALLGTGATLAAQEPPSAVELDEALDLFRRNSPELEMARSRFQRAAGLARQGRAAPNPVASLTREQLNGYTESYVLVSQPLDFVWAGAPRAAAAEARIAAASARQAADSVRLTTAVKRTFVSAWERARAVEALRVATELIGELVGSAQARVSEGDVAGYDLRRLRWEHAHISRRMALAELDLEDAERRLGSYVSADARPVRVRASGLDPAGPPEATPGDAGSAVLGGRAEIVAAADGVRASEADARIARTSVLGGTRATAGVKWQSDGANGWYVGLEVPVPLVDRRGGARSAAAAAVREARAESDLLARTIAREAGLAEARLASLRQQRVRLLDDAAQGADDLLRIARLAYEEGETGLVELVDAAKAFVDARLLDSAVEAEAWIAFFELEAAVGGFGRTEDGGRSDR